MPKGSGKKIPKVKVIKKISKEDAEKLILTLEERFKENMNRHKGMRWGKIEDKLKSSKKKLLSLYNMEKTGGEPDVVGKEKGKYIFMDCSEQSPDRRSICYDRAGEKERKNKGVHPGGNAVELAEKMGIELLDEEQYHELQELGEFDTKTESWLKTPADVRKLGGAIFGDRRYGRVFVFHNSAPSFYSARGFRAMLLV